MDKITISSKIDGIWMDSVYCSMTRVDKVIYNGCVIYNRALKSKERGSQQQTTAKVRKPKRPAHV